MATPAQLYLPDRPRIAGMSFDLRRLKANNPTRGGNHQDVQMGEPLWSCELRTTDLEKSLAGEYKWLKAVADDSDQTVYLFDAEREYPLYYGRGGGWGNPVVESVNRAASTITLSGFTSGARIAPGDYGHWDDGPARRLHICEGGVAGGMGGGWLTMKVRPPPPETPDAALPVPFVMARASAEMKIIQMEAPFRAPVLSSVSLTAVQVIRRY